jgi:hypothetical protein
MRVRARTFRVLPEVAAEVAQRLREEPGVQEVEVVARTGSLLIHYSPRAIELPRLVEVLVRSSGLHGLEVDVDAGAVMRPRPGSVVRDTLSRWDDALRGAASGKADLRTAVPGTLAAAGIGVLLFGRRRVPEWYDLMFWSFVTFVNLNPPETRDASRT